MKTRFSTSVRFLFTFGAAVWLVAPRIIADEARFFRVVGPTATTITAFTADGYITWTNAQPGTDYTVQTARNLAGPSNWVDYIQVPVIYQVTTHRIYDPNPPSGMALIPAGNLATGDTLDGESDALPLHTNYVSGFYMDQYLVTSNLWYTVKSWNGGNGYGYDHAGSGKASNHPVQNVDWFDVVKWCNARSQMEGLAPCYYTDSGLTAVYKTGQVALYVNWSTNGYRLPTEAEWEKAARGGLSGHRFPWGDTISEDQANYFSCSSCYSYDLSNTGLNPTFNDGGFPPTSPVGCLAANGYGLYDMAGNVWEWCWDWWDGTYYSSSPGTDPRGPAVSPYGWRMLRGGSWNADAYNSRCAYRTGNYPPTAGNNDAGFRCVRGL